MILQALVKYYENLAEQGKVSRLGWCHAKVSYEINLSSEGDIIGITSRKIEDMRGKKVVWGTGKSRRAGDGDQIFRCGS